MTCSVQILIKRMPGTDDLSLPEYRSVGAAGMDIQAAVGSPVRIETGRVALVPTGIAIAVPPGYEAQLRPRSGLATKHGVTLINAPGTIDADYRGEILVALINLGVDAFEVTRGLRIAQMVVAPVAQVQWHETEILPPTSRGDGGFGHTGI